VTAPAETKKHWLIERRLRVYPRLLLGVLAVAIPVDAATFHNGVDGRGQALGSDFIAFWSAARMAVEGHGLQAWNLHHLASVQFAAFPGLAGPTPWVYPPATLLLVAPLGYLSHGVAFLVWTAVGLGAFFLALAPIISGRRYAWPLAVAFPGVSLGIAQGQTQFVVAALAGGALLLLDRRLRWAGVLIGLLVIKPQLAVLFPVILVAERRWRTFAVAALTALGAMAAGVLTFGLGSLRLWLQGMQLLAAATNSAALPVYKFVTPYAAFRLVGMPEVPALALHVLVATGVVVVVWRVWRRTTDLRVRGSAVVIGTFLVTPHAADYDLALLAFPIAWLALLGMEQGWLRGDRNLLVLTWLLPWVTAPIGASTHIGVTPLLLACLLRQVWRRTASASARTTPETVRGDHRQPAADRGDRDSVEVAEIPAGPFPASHRQAP
jgi:hypothetical protein